MLSKLKRVLCSHYFWIAIYTVAIFSLLMMRYVFYIYKLRPRAHY